jgi:hypothetical protein
VGESPLQETAITTAARSTTVQTRCFQLGTDVLQTLAAPPRRSVTKVSTGPDPLLPAAPLQLTRIDPR